MKIGVLNEISENESRVSMIPPVAKDLIDDGHEVLIETGAGEATFLEDEDYKDVGCNICESREEVIENANILLKVNGLTVPDISVDLYEKDQIIIGMLDPYDLKKDQVEILLERNISAFALELMVRISWAQSMDVLFTMANISGYKAVTIAADALPKIFPMEMTSAGTVQPAEVFVLGAGVAGLKAISTAERLGATVQATDVRPEVRDEVESLGAEFIETAQEDLSDEEGYAKEQDESFEERQKKMLKKVLPDQDVVITTANIPGKQAPQPITADLVETMKPGSVIVDIAAESGGNCELTEASEKVEHEGVTILGPVNLPSKAPQTSSKLYSNNLKNFLNNLLGDDGLKIDTDDDVIDSTLLTHKGEIRKPLKEIID